MSEEPIIVEETKVRLTQSMRISWSIGKKVSDGNYGSLDLHHSVSDEVGAEESYEEANKRIFTMVQESHNKAMEYKIKQLGVKK